MEGSHFKFLSSNSEAKQKLLQSFWKRRLQQRQVFVSEQRCHSFASEIIWGNMHPHDNSNQHYHCDVCSIAGRGLGCPTEDKDMNVVCQMPGYQEKAREDASSSSSYLSIPCHCSSINFESKHNMNGGLSVAHIGNSHLYSLHGRLNTAVASILLSLLPGGMPKSTVTLRLGFALIFFLFFCLSSSNASAIHTSQSLDKPHSNSRTWISSQLKFDLQDSLEIESDVTASKFEFPELVALTGRLFWYQIPVEAFPNLERISHYKVTEAGRSDPPSWLYLDANIPGLVLGVPLNSQISHIYISIEAHGVEAHTRKQAAFNEIISINITNTSRCDGVAETTKNSSRRNTFDCSSKGNIIFKNFVFTREIVKMNPLERGNLFLGVAKLLNVDTEDISLRELDASHVNGLKLWIQLVKFYDHKHLGKATILTVASGCSNKDKNQEEHVELISHLIRTLKQSFTSCQDGLSIHGRVEHLLRCGAWFVNQAGVVISCSEDPLVETVHPLKELSHHRVRRQVVNIEPAEENSTSSIMSPLSSMLESSKTGKVPMSMNSSLEIVSIPLDSRSAESQIRNATIALTRDVEVQGTQFIGSDDLSSQSTHVMLLTRVVPSSEPTNIIGPPSSSLHTYPTLSSFHPIPLKPVSSSSRQTYTPITDISLSMMEESVTVLASEDEMEIIDLSDVTIMEISSLVGEISITPSLTSLTPSLTFFIPSLIDDLSSIAFPSSSDLVHTMSTLLSTMEESVTVLASEDEIDFSDVTIMEISSMVGEISITPSPTSFPPSFTFFIPSLIDDLSSIAFPSSAPSSSDLVDTMSTLVFVDDSSSSANFFFSPTSSIEVVDTSLVFDSSMISPSLSLTSSLFMSDISLMSMSDAFVFPTSTSLFNTLSITESLQSSFAAPDSNSLSSMAFVATPSATPSFDETETVASFDVSSVQIEMSKDVISTGIISSSILTANEGQSIFMSDIVSLADSTRITEDDTNTLMAIETTSETFMSLTTDIFPEFTSALIDASSLVVVDTQIPSGMVTPLTTFIMIDSIFFTTSVDALLTSHFIPVMATPSVEISISDDNLSNFMTNVVSLSEFLEPTRTRQEENTVTSATTEDDQTSDETFLPLTTDIAREFSSLMVDISSAIIVDTVISSAVVMTDSIFLTSSVDTILSSTTSIFILVMSTPSAEISISDDDFSTNIVSQTDFLETTRIREDHTLTFIPAMTTVTDETFVVDGSSTAVFLTLTTDSVTEFTSDLVESSSIAVVDTPPLTPMVTSLHTSIMTDLIFLTSSVDNLRSSATSSFILTMLTGTSEISTSDVGLTIFTSDVVSPTDFLESTGRQEDTVTFILPATTLTDHDTISENLLPLTTDISREFTSIMVDISSAIVIHTPISSAVVTTSTMADSIFLTSSVDVLLSGSMSAIVPVIPTDTSEISISDDGVSTFISDVISLTDLLKPMTMTQEDAVTFTPLVTSIMVGESSSEIILPLTTDQEFMVDASSIVVVDTPISSPSITADSTFLTTSVHAFLSSATSTFVPVMSTPSVDISVSDDSRSNSMTNVMSLSEFLEPTRTRHTLTFTPPETTILDQTGSETFLPLTTDIAQVSAMMDISSAVSVDILVSSAVVMTDSMFLTRSLDGFLSSATPTIIPIITTGTAETPISDDGLGIMTSDIDFLTGFLDPTSTTPEGTARLMLPATTFTDVGTRSETLLHLMTDASEFSSTIIDISSVNISISPVITTLFISNSIFLVSSVDALLTTATSALISATPTPSVEISISDVDLTILISEVVSPTDFLESTRITHEDTVTFMPPATTVMVDETISENFFPLTTDTAPEFTSVIVDTLSAIIIDTPISSAVVTTSTMTDLISLAHSANDLLSSATSDIGPGFPTGMSENSVFDDVLSIFMSVVFPTDFLELTRTTQEDIASTTLTDDVTFIAEETNSEIFLPLTTSSVPEFTPVMIDASSSVIVDTPTSSAVVTSLPTFIITDAIFVTRSTDAFLSSATSAFIPVMPTHSAEVLTSDDGLSVFTSDIISLTDTLEPTRTRQRDEVTFIPPEDTSIDDETVVIDETSSEFFLSPTTGIALELMSLTPISSAVVTTSIMTDSIFLTGSVDTLMSSATSFIIPVKLTPSAEPSISDGSLSIFISDVISLTDSLEPTRTRQRDEVTFIPPEDTSIDDETVMIDETSSEFFLSPTTGIAPELMSLTPISSAVVTTFIMTDSIVLTGSVDTLMSSATSFIIPVMLTPSAELSISDGSLSIFISDVISLTDFLEPTTMGQEDTLTFMPTAATVMVDETNSETFLTTLTDIAQEFTPVMVNTSSVVDIPIPSPMVTSLPTSTMIDLIILTSSVDTVPPNATSAFVPVMSSGTFISDGGFSIFISDVVSLTDFLEPTRMSQEDTRIIPSATITMGDGKNSETFSPLTTDISPEFTSMFVDISSTIVVDIPLSLATVTTSIMTDLTITSPLDVLLTTALITVMPTSSPGISNSSDSLSIFMSTILKLTRTTQEAAMTFMPTVTSLIDDETVTVEDITSDIFLPMATDTALEFTSVMEDASSSVPVDTTISSTMVTFLATSIDSIFLTSSVDILLSSMPAFTSTPSAETSVSFDSLSIFIPDNVSPTDFLEFTRTGLDDPVTATTVIDDNFFNETSSKIFLLSATDADSELVEDISPTAVEEITVSSPMETSLSTSVISDSIYLTRSIDGLLSTATSVFISLMPTPSDEISISDDGLSIYMSNVASLTDFMDPTRMRPEETVTVVIPNVTFIVDETNSDSITPVNTNISPEITSVTINTSSVVVVDTLIPSAMGTSLPNSIFRDSTFLTSSVDPFASTMSSFTPVMPTPSAKISISEDDPSIFLSEVVSLTDLSEPTRVSQKDTMTFLPSSTTDIDDETSFEIFFPMSTDFLPELSSVMVNASPDVGLGTSSTIVTDSIFLTSSVDALLSSAMLSFDIVPDSSDSIEQTPTLIPDPSELESSPTTDFVMVPESSVVSPLPLSSSPSFSICEFIDCKNGICREILTGFTCDCFLGWEGDYCEKDIDFCESYPCDSLMSVACVDGNSTYACKCQVGYSGQNCSFDINECDPNPCMNHATCGSKIGGFTCTCQTGFTGSLCEVINPCEPEPCLNGGICNVSDSGNVFCNCPPEWTGFRCDNPVDPCLSFPCANNGICETVSLNYGLAVKCLCHPGFEGNFCEDIKDPCLSQPCLNEGDCSSLSPTSFNCTCPQGFVGTLCQELEDFCLLNPCFNNGSCSLDMDNMINCRCSPGYEGFLCENRIDPCLSSPCINNASCTNISTGNGFECSCSPEYTGLICEKEINPCENSPCFNNGTCTEIAFNIFTCVCNEDYSGMLCDVLISTCDSKPCMNNGSCIRMSSENFTCSCPEDYTGSLCDLPIDPCDTMPCMNNGSCGRLSFENFTCSCLEDYTGSLCDVPIDPCDSMPCMNNGYCGRLSFENFTCSCQEDYTGSLCDVLIDPCDSMPCMNNGSCDRLSFENFTCSCPEDYTGSLCDVPIDPCGSMPCMNNGSCGRLSFENFTCSCQEYYTGSLCDVPIDPCASMPCMNNGSCGRLSFENFTCSCQEDYTGSLCDVPIDPCASMPCMNNGSCGRLSFENFTCSCQEDYTGSLCDVPIDPCNSMPCMNNGYCGRLSFENFTCSCQEDYTGSLCDVPIDPCNSMPCMNNGSCGRLSFENFTCSCPEDYTGSLCDLPIDPCDTMPCMNNGSCGRLSFENFTCSCPEDYTGSLCDVLIDPCDSMPCMNNGSCGRLSFENFTCSCQEDYTGSLCDVPIDPCGSMPCINNGSCGRLSFENFTCSCQEYYTGSLCDVPIDPCASMPCMNNGSCGRLSFENFTCSCQEDYTGSLCDVPIDPCASMPCMNNGSCGRLSFENFTCSCQEDYTGSLCDVPIDPCNSMPCMNNGYCGRLSFENFTCSCQEDYTGSLCDVPIDPCNSMPCMNNGSCGRLSFENFTCSCPEDYTGSLCDLPIDPCDTIPCMNNGSCGRLSFENFTCSCPEDYTGSLCDVLIDPCDSMPCMNNGSCGRLSFENFTCSCQEDYTGSLCDVPIDPCDSMPCMNNGSCERLSFENFTCSCPEDYTGSLCDVPIDPCGSMPCMNNGSCGRLSFENFTCSCQEYYTGSLCDVPIDPCASMPCMNNGSCGRLSFENFTCSCQEDYTGSLCDVPIDPCNSMPCMNNGYCGRLSFENFTCSCQEDYTGSLCDVPIDPCNSMPCMNNGSCGRLSFENFTCSCPEDYKGSLCDVPIDPCGSMPCMNNGSCERLSFENFTCSCQEDYTGSLCDVPIDPCGSMPCMNNGSCERLSFENFTCSCQEDYTGSLCDVPIDPCGSMPCMNNGSCGRLSFENFTCSCQEYYTGSLCDVPIDPCASMPCMNNGSCGRLSFENFTCSCQEDYTGSLCDVPIDPCNSMPCMNNGYCGRLSFENFTCSCQEDYTGSLCDVPIDPCNSMPCMNNGSCGRLSFENFTCSCPEDYKGSLCDVPIDPCGSMPCMNNGSCERLSFENFTCSCQEDYTGSLCDVPIDPCGSMPCMNNGSCERLSFENFTCSCQEDYTGSLCDLPIDPCDTMPCLNNGSCGRLSYENFTCSCPEHYTGSLCDLPIDPCDSMPCMNNGSCGRLSFENFTCSCAEGYTGVLCDFKIEPCFSYPCLNNGSCREQNITEFICICVSRYSGVFCEIPPPNRSPVLLNPVETLFATEGRLFKSTLPIPIFYDPDTGDSSSLTLMLLDSNNLLSNTTWIQLSSDGSSLEAIPTSDQLARVGVITEHVFILRATDMEGDSSDTFVFVMIFPQNPPVLNLLTIFIDGDYTLFSQTLSDRLLFVSLLASFGNRDGGVSDSDNIYLNQFQSGIAVTYSNLSIPNSNCADFMEWVFTVYSFEMLQYTQSFSDAVEPFTLIKTPFFEGPCNISDGNVSQTSTVGIVINTGPPILLLSIVVPSAVISLLSLIVGLACFILYRRRWSERRKLTTKYMKKTFLHRRPVILSGELRLPARRGFPTILPGEVIVNPKKIRWGWKEVTRRAEEEGACILRLEAVGVSDEESEEDGEDREDREEREDGEERKVRGKSLLYGSILSFSQQTVDLTYDDPPPEYSLPPLYSCVKTHET